MTDRSAVGKLVRGARHRVRTELSGRRHSTVSDVTKAPEVSVLESILTDHSDESVRSSALALGRDPELATILAARSTVKPVVLSDDQVAGFFANGFLAVPQMSSPEEVAAICRIYDQLFASKQGQGQGLYTDLPQEAHLEGQYFFPKIHQIYRVAPELCATGFMANARAAAVQLFGSDVEFLGGHGFRKPAHSPTETPWHQDQAYHVPNLIFRNVNFWLALQDTPVEAGTMEFTIGSHHGDVVFEHRRPGGVKEAHGLEMVDISGLGDIVSCPLQSGGATLHHSYTPHHTPPNDTAEPRRALIAIFAIPPTKRVESIQFSWQDEKAARPGLGPASRQTVSQTA
jgi:phytanoyl-CoA hydroxylase